MRTRENQLPRTIVRVIYIVCKLASKVTPEALIPFCKALKVKQKMILFQFLCPIFEYGISLRSLLLSQAWKNK